MVGATEGNLGAHIGTLEQAGYVEVEKDFVGKKPRTRVRASRTGRRAFETYIAYLRDIVEAASGGLGGRSTSRVPSRSFSNSRQCRSAAAWS